MKNYLMGAAVALSVVAFAPAANAVVIGAAGQTNLPFATLSTAGLNGGALATLVGGTVLTADQPNADIPKGILFGGNFLAAGLTAGQPATLTFNQTVNVFGFLIGSPDSYNLVTITSTAGAFTFTPLSLGISTNGDQTVAQYVNFRTTGVGERILTATFTNLPPNDAFEIANFSAGAGAIPEPAAWGMMIAGFGLVGGALRRRVNTTVKFA